MLPCCSHSSHRTRRTIRRFLSGRTNVCSVHLFLGRSPNTAGRRPRSRRSPGRSPRGRSFATCPLLPTRTMPQLRTSGNPDLLIPRIGAADSPACRTRQSPQPVMGSTLAGLLRGSCRPLARTRPEPPPDAPVPHLRRPGAPGRRTRGTRPTPLGHHRATTASSTGAQRAVARQRQREP
jgi:hypothetical protein